MFKKYVITLLFLCILVVGACKPEDSIPSPLSATLSEITGKVETKLAGQEAFTPATADSVLKVNGQIQTGDDGRVRLDLSSGTIIRVAPSSLFTLTSNDEVEGGLATKIKLEIGKVFIILNGGSADVETPSGVASVRGSYMKVEVDPETMDIYVTCLEGDCSANNPAGSTNFTNGQKVILFHRDPVRSIWTVPGVESMTPEEFQEWLDEIPEAKELFNQAIATMTAVVEPTASPAPVFESVVPAAGASNTCFNVIQPVTGASLPYQGKVKFEWKPQPDAQKYIVSFTNSNGNMVNFETTDTKIEKIIEGFMPNPGEYSWAITAYSEDGNVICSTAETTFSKPDSYPEPPTAVKETEEKPIVTTSTEPPTVAPTPTDPPTVAPTSTDSPTVVPTPTDLPTVVPTPTNLP